MNIKKSLLNINLRLFDGEGASAGGEGAATGAAETVQTSPGKKSKGAEVVYGKQPEPTPNTVVQTATEQKTEPNVDPVARKAEFDRIMGDYKDLFQEKTQSIIDKRFKETKNLEKQLGDTRPILDTLMSKYGVEDGDVAKLTKAIEADDQYWEELADKEGLTVEQYKMKQKLESENASLKKVQNDIQAQQKTQQIYQAWLQEADTIKANDYPDFNLEAELSNTQFVNLIGSGHIDLKTAYEVLHMGEIKSGVAKKAESNVANTIRANGQRPSENGTASQSGVITKSDVSKLSRQDREEVARRVARGEKIEF